MQNKGTRRSYRGAKAQGYGTVYFRFGYNYYC